MDLEKEQELIRLYSSLAWSKNDNSSATLGQHIISHAVLPCPRSQQNLDLAMLKFAEECKSNRTGVAPIRLPNMQAVHPGIFKHTYYNSSLQTLPSIATMLPVTDGSGLLLEKSTVRESIPRNLLRESLSIADEIALFAAKNTPPPAPPAQQMPIPIVDQNMVRELAAAKAQIAQLNTQLSAASRVAANAQAAASQSRFSSASRPSPGDDEEPSQKKPYRNPFVSAKDRFKEDGGNFPQRNQGSDSAGGSQDPTNRMSDAALNRKGTNSSKDDGKELPPELAHCDKALVERIEADIIHSGQPVTFEDIAGLRFAKDCVIELICWPMAQPSLFQGLRSLPRGVLLFGPPGTGKTLIGKAIAHQSGATFFSISASSLMSKWIGEGEKTVRTLFAIAAYRQPSVVFIDEVDSLLSARSSEENEATRRIKTEFMVQLDGASTNPDARVVILGATNRPEELDEAVRRRFVKRLYIPLPDSESRRDLFQRLLKDSVHSLKDSDIEELVTRTDHFSGADIRSLCTEAAMGPIRELAYQRSGDLNTIRDSDVPAITAAHFAAALDTVSPSVSANDLQRYIEWNSTYGSYKRIS